LTETAFLGIGSMGHGMATSALRAGIPTIVWNREPEATRDLAELGAEVAETAADAARRAAIVVTMVTDADAVVSIARDQGLLAALAPGAIWAQMSTIGVAGIERVAAVVDADRPDVMLLDAPVSGSKDPAELGHLVSMVDAGTVELVRGLGVDVLSSADLIQHFEARWSAAALASASTALKLPSVRLSDFVMAGGEPGWSRSLIRRSLLGRSRGRRR